MQWQEAFEKAETLLNAGYTDEAIHSLSRANQLCRDRKERQEKLFGNLLTQNGMSGIASLVAAQSQRGNTETAYKLLDFIERYGGAGDGVTLLDIWVPLIWEFLKEYEFPQARDSFKRCMQIKNQYTASRHPTVGDLVNHCAYLAQSLCLQEDFAHAVSLLEFALEFEETEPVRGEIFRIINRIQSSQPVNVALNQLMEMAILAH